MKAKVIITIMLMLCGVYSVKADLAFDGGYNIYDDSYGCHGEVWVENDAILDVIGGDIFQLGTLDYSITNIYEGQIDRLLAKDNSIVNTYGGNVKQIINYYSGMVNIYGGNIDQLSSIDNGVVSLYAYDILYHSTGGGALGNLAWIEGIYCRNNIPFSFCFSNEITYSHIRIIPEPITILLLGLGGLFLRRKR